MFLTNTGTAIKPSLSLRAPLPFIKITKHTMGDMADDMEAKAMEYESEVYSREAMWRNGTHETRDGQMLKLKDMSTQHLQNTINHFADYE